MDNLDKCLLTDEELEEYIRKDYKDFRVRDENGYVQDLLIWTRKAQHAKTEAIIRGEQAEEIKRDIEKLLITTPSIFYINKAVLKDYWRKRGLK